MVSLKRLLLELSRVRFIDIDEVSDELKLGEQADPSARYGALLSLERKGYCIVEKPRSEDLVCTSCGLTGTKIADLVGFAIDKQFNVPLIKVHGEVLVCEVCGRVYIVLGRSARVTVPTDIGSIVESARVLMEDLTPSTSHSLHTLIVYCTLACREEDVEYGRYLYNEYVCRNKLFTLCRFTCSCRRETQLSNIVTKVGIDGGYVTFVGDCRVCAFTCKLYLRVAPDREGIDSVLKLGKIAQELDE